MNNDIKQMLLVSLNAQYHYVIARMHNIQQIRIFEIESAVVLQMIEIYSNFNEQIINKFDYFIINEIQTAVYKIYFETYNNLNKRFVLGYSTDMVLEKL